MDQVIKFCDNCVEEANRPESNVAGSFFKPFPLCAPCLQSRTEYVSHLKRDAAYRSHVSRQLAGILCDESSACPHHAASEAKYAWNAFDEHSTKQMVEILKAWKEVRKTSYEEITAKELLGGHHLSLVQYCTSCYDQACETCISIGDKRLFGGSVKLCPDCLQKREYFIETHHRHQSDFKEPWTRRNSRFASCQEVRSTEKFKYDSYLDAWTSDLSGGGSWDTSTTVQALFGVMTVLGFPNLTVYLVKRLLKWRKEKKNGSDIETGGEERDIELGTRGGEEVAAPDDAPVALAIVQETAVNEVDGGARAEEGGEGRAVPDIAPAVSPAVFGATVNEVIEGEVGEEETGEGRAVPDSAPDVSPVVFGATVNEVIGEEEGGEGGPASDGTPAVPPVVYGATNNTVGIGEEGAAQRAREINHDKLGEADS